MSLFQNKKKWNSIKMFLYVLPFIVLVLIFASAGAKKYLCHERHYAGNFLAAHDIRRIYE